MRVKRLSLLFLLLTLLTSLLPPTAAQAAVWEEITGGVTFPSGTLILDAAPTTSTFVSRLEYVIPDDVVISRPDPIVRVELRNSAGEVKGTMTHTSGDTYHLDTPIQGTVLPVVSREKATLSDGTFEWFRDPTNRRIWMFDYADAPAEGEDPLTETPINRYYRQMSGEFPRPQGGSCPATIRSITNISTLPTIYPDTQPCNEATTTRSGTLNTSTVHDFKFDEGFQSVSITDVSELSFDMNDFKFNAGSGNNLTKDNVRDIVPMPIDTTNYNYRFDYTLVFDVDQDEISSDDGDGRVLLWWDNWEIPLKGHVYKHDKLKLYVMTEEPTEKTDLTVLSLTGPSCIEAGTSGTYKYTLTNSGPATSSPFKVKVTADDTEVITHTIAGIDSSKEGTFTYTFPTAGTKSFTVLANSDNTVDEQSIGNNTNTVSFTAVTDCGGGGDPEDPGGCSLGSACPGEWTGTLNVHYPTIDWKNPNDFNVTLINPANGCTAQKGRFRVAQGMNQYSYGWTSLAGSTDSTAFAWGMDGSSTYPGNIGPGIVQVLYNVEDSCGRISTIGPETFEIIKIAGAPAIQVDWHKTSTNATTVEVIQNENVFVKAVASDSKNEDVTLNWTFTGSTSWLAGLPAAMGWTSPLNKGQYNNIAATEKGSHKVCVTATNESGISASACSTLFVIGPDPIAVIDVGGWLKEGRRIELAGNRSSSPKGSELTYAWSIAPVAGQTTGTLADIAYIAPLTGVYKDFKTSVKGSYKVTLIVTDTEGLTGTAFADVSVQEDLPPIVTLVGNAVTTRQPTDRGLGTFTLLGTGLSIDQDLITHRYWSLTYDYNNDGIYNEAVTNEVEEGALNLGWEYTYNSGPEPLIIVKTGLNAVQVKGQHVGKYKIRLRIIEAPGQPTNLVH
jgi:hypothetical protein